MDAISFVLGLDAKKLRAGKLDDLVNEEVLKHNKEVKKMEQAQEASVALFFVDNSGEDHVFTRSLRLRVDVAGNRTYADTYRYNNHHDKKEYIKGLRSIGVTVDVPNCLVFQVRYSLCHTLLKPPHCLN